MYKELEGKAVKLYEYDGGILFGTLLTSCASSVTIEVNGVLYHLPIILVDRIEPCL